MKILALSLSLAVAASLSFAPSQAKAADCAAEWHAFETAVDTADYICSQGDDAGLCSYAQNVAIDAGRAYSDCMLRDSGQPVG